MIKLGNKEILRIKNEEILLNSIDSYDPDSEVTISLRNILNLLNVEPLILKLYCDKMKMRETIAISMRKGMLLVFEEKLTVLSVNRTDCHYDEIYSEGNKKYKYGNKKKSEYPTLEIIHPEDVHSKYESMFPDDYGRQIKMLKKYNRDLLQILANQHWLINDEKVSQSLFEIYEEVKQSLNL